MVGERSSRASTDTRSHTGWTVGEYDEAGDWRPDDPVCSRCESAEHGNGLCETCARDALSVAALVEETEALVGQLAAEVARNGNGTGPEAARALAELRTWLAVLS